MKYFLILLSLVSFGGIVYAEEYDLCENIEGIQTTYPSGYSSVGSPGTCYVLPPPVTVDVNPVGSGVDAVTIDVNPAPASSGEPGSIPSDRKIITSTEELQTYTFSTDSTPQERITLIQERLKATLIQLIEMLTKQIAELQAQL